MAKDLIESLSAEVDAMEARLDALQPPIRGWRRRRQPPNPTVISLNIYRQLVEDVERLLDDYGDDD